MPDSQKTMIVSKRPGEQRVGERSSGKEDDREILVVDAMSLNLIAEEFS